MRNFVYLGIFLALCLVATPLVSGQVVNLTVNNNCDTGCNPPVPQGTLIGTITVAQGSISNTLTVTLQMAPGFTLKVQDGNDFNFQGLSGMSVSGVGVKWAGGPKTYTPETFGVSQGKNADGFGTFGYNITGIGMGQLRSITSVDSLQFTITCAKTSKTCTPTDLIRALNSKGADFAIHFCDASGTNCPQGPGGTGYAANKGVQVPEPSILGLLACSAVVFGGFFRRLL